MRNALCPLCGPGTCARTVQLDVNSLLNLRMFNPSGENPFPGCHSSGHRAIGIGISIFFFRYDDIEESWNGRCPTKSQGKTLFFYLTYTQTRINDLGSSRVMAICFILSEYRRRRQSVIAWCLVFDTFESMAGTAHFFHASNLGKVSIYVDCVDCLLCCCADMECGQLYAWIYGDWRSARCKAYSLTDFIVIATRFLWPLSRVRVRAYTELYAGWSKDITLEKHWLVMSSLGAELIV